MSDVNPTESTKPEDLKIKKPQRVFFGKRLVIGLVGFAVIGILGQQVWTMRLWERLQREDVAVDSVDSRLAALESALADQQGLQQEMAALRQSFLRDRLVLQLDRIEEQLDAGWQIWLATGNNKPLGQALERGQNLLANVPMAEVQVLRQTMATDLAGLANRQVLDLRETMQQLDGVIATIDKLPLLQERRIQAAPSEMTNSPLPDVDVPTLMDKARALVTEIGEEIWQSIRRMVRVQRLDQAEPALIAPEQKIFLQQGVRLLLLDARHALVERNAAVYQQSLSQARSWIVKYFDSADALVRNDLELLQRLASIQMDPAAVDFDATRKALDALRNALLGVEPAAESMAPTGGASTEPSAKGSAT